MNRIALVTVCTPNFIRGTQTLFHTFRKHHAALDIDFIVICDQGLEPFKKAFRGFNPQFHLVSDELIEAIHHFERESNTQGIQTSARFYSLELFRLAQYDKVLFMDSDMICQAGFEGLFESKDDFYACPDRLYYQGLTRDYDTFEVLRPDTVAGKKLITPTFNTGFMLVGKSHLSLSVYHDLVQHLRENKWNTMARGLNDQIVVNQFFKEQIAPLSASFNYILKIEKDIRKQEGLAPENSRVLHWIGYPKPWHFKQLLIRLLKRKKLPERWSIWMRNYLNYLSRP